MNSTFFKTNLPNFFDVKRSLMGFFPTTLHFLLVKLLSVPSFFRHWKKFGGFVLTCTHLVHKTNPWNFSRHWSSKGFFLQSLLNIFVFIIFSWYYGSSPCEFDFAKKKPTKFLSALKEAWWVFFVQPFIFFVLSFFRHQKKLNKFLFTKKKTCTPLL